MLFNIVSTDGFDNSLKSIKKALYCFQEDSDLDTLANDIKTAIAENDIDKEVKLNVVEKLKKNKLEIDENIIKEIVEQVSNAQLYTVIKYKNNDKNESPAVDKSQKKMPYLDSYHSIFLERDPKKEKKV